MLFLYLMTLNLQKKTGKIITPEDSKIQWVYKWLVFQLKTNMAAVLRYLLPAIIKQAG